MICAPSSVLLQIKSTAHLRLQWVRLLEARRLMLKEQVNAVTAVDRVDYESPSQFSREYARMLGAAPIGDIQQLRMGQLANG